MTKKISNITMEELLAKSGAIIKGFSRGQRISAKLTKLSENAAFFDIGGKSEGVVTDVEFTSARDFLATLSVGDTVEAIVIVPETPEGIILLSLRNSVSDSVWEKFARAKKEGSEISVTAKHASPAGVSVEVNGITGFIPLSQLGKKAAKNPEGLVGKSFKVKVVEVDKARGKLIFSEKEVSEAGEIKASTAALKKIKVGQVYEGVVTTVSNFGAFVQIKADQTPVEGLVHVSELAWEKVEKPQDVINVGDKVKVKVIAGKSDKLALSVKQAQKDPWEEASAKLKVNDTLKGKVVKLSDFGAFIQLTPGVEGLLHVTKIPPTQKLSVGDTITCNIEEIDTKTRKISLGLVLTSKPVGYK